ncbi:pentapeptide repeat-containing protein [Luteococcus peritonei]|uniref:Pentapeptide repeat-containing protein n=1 Tax=Luteococcus peritonei TaxID=88874 RepID=A0ABW4RU31_9ACTN
MQALPRHAHPPKLSEREVRLQSVADLGPSSVGSDDLVTEQEVTLLSLEAHSTEFVELASLRVARGSLADSDWYRTNWVDVELNGVDAANAAFTESGLKRVAWRGCRLVGIALSGCTLADLEHRDCQMSLANFRFANLQRVSFTGCDLTGADFTNARLQDVSFTDCTLEGASFSQATSTRVSLSGGSLVGLKGLDGLRGATIRVDDLYDIAHEMAGELGLHLVED